MIKGEEWRRLAHATAETLERLGHPEAAEILFRAVIEDAQIEAATSDLRDAIGDLVEMCTKPVAVRDLGVN